MLSPALKLFDKSKPNEVHTDASSLRVAGMLMQRHNDKLHLVYAVSKRCSPSKSLYHSSHFKLLGYCLGIEPFTLVHLRSTFHCSNQLSMYYTSAHCKGHKRSTCPLGYSYLRIRCAVQTLSWYRYGSRWCDQQCSVFWKHQLQYWAGDYWFYPCTHSCCKPCEWNLYTSVRRSRNQKHNQVRWSSW